MKLGLLRQSVCLLTSAQTSPLTHSSVSLSPLSLIVVLSHSLIKNFFFKLPDKEPFRPTKNPLTRSGSSVESQGSYWNQSTLSLSLFLS